MVSKQPKGKVFFFVIVFRKDVIELIETFIILNTVAHVIELG